MTAAPAPTTSATALAPTPSEPVDAGQPVDPDDPRQQISVGVLMLNGRLAGRSFVDLAEAEAWAQPGEQVVEYNFLCECDR